MQSEDLPVRPWQDYMLVEYVETDTGVVKTEDIRDSKMKGKILAIGPGTWQFGVFIKTELEVGMTVLWEEQAAEANTPTELKDRNMYLVKEARVTAIVNEGKQ